jgi:GxxExxY protein
MTRKRPDRLHLLERELTGEIISAYYECYNILGYGFLESVYRKALAIELNARGIATREEGAIEVTFKGVVVGTFRFDLLVEKRVLVEAKAGISLGLTDKRQLLNYLRATRLEVGLLLHFGPEPTFRRCVHQRFLGPDS